MVAGFVIGGNGSVRDFIVGLHRPVYEIVIAALELVLLLWLAAKTPSRSRWPTLVLFFALGVAAAEVFRLAISHALPASQY